MQITESNVIDIVGALNYQCANDAFDEMCTPTGELRPQWEYLMQSLAAMGEGELQRRCQDARRLLRENGVTYNAYGDPAGADRPWQLDPIPLLITSDEWRVIERGLMQRADLLRLVLADLYGARESVRKGILPSELIDAYPGFLRPCVDIEPPSSQYILPFYAADLTRAADGAMYAIEDRSQAPPGAGYALENRMVLSRVLPSLFRDSHVHRLALYFRTLRQTLMNMAWRKADDVRVVVISPGPAGETYFEHAYLAKYLGYTLVEGADLTVRDGRVWLKTLDGLQPVDVILRFVDDPLCDPLELRQDSTQGVAGLLQAMRMKKVAVANPIGSGVLENRALLNYMPDLARFFIGEELQLISPPTLWCGLGKERDYVLANLSRLVIKTTLRTPGALSIRGRTLNDQQLTQLRERIRQQPYLYVGQEEVARSQMPVFADGKLTPRETVLRSFLVATEDDYMAMPGGLTRVAGGPDQPVLSVQSGGISKDTWVLASEPVKQLTLVSSQRQIQLFLQSQGELPSRVAENLFWLGRYAERAEGVIRLLRVVFFHLTGPDDVYAGDGERAYLHHLLRATTQLTETFPGFVGEGAEQRLAMPEAELLSIFLDKSRPGSLAFTLQALLYAVRSVRDRISPDIWRVFNDVDEGLQQLQVQRDEHEAIDQALAELNHLLTTFAAFTGLAIDSMIHGQGWLFLMLGRRLERAQQMLSLFHQVLVTISDDETILLESLLKICDSLMTYRSRYRTQVQIQTTLDLLLQDESNPRSLGYQLKHLQSDIQSLPRQDGIFPYKSQEKRLVLEALTLVRLADTSEMVRPDEQSRPVFERFLANLEELLPRLSNAITNSYFSHAEQPRQLVRFVGEGD